MGVDFSEHPSADQPCRYYEGENYRTPTGFIACATHGSFGVGWVTRSDEDGGEI